MLAYLRRLIYAVVCSCVPVLGWAEVDIGVHLGNQADAKTVKDYEEQIGRHIKSVSFYYSLNPAIYPAFDKKKYNDIRYHDGYDTHTIMHIVFEPWVSLKDIAEGKYDTYFSSYANAARQWGEEIRFRFAHEMIHDDNPNTVGWYSWQDQPEDYKNAFRHLYRLFHSQGAENVKFVWSPNYHISDLKILEKYYPGSEYVDWIGMDGWGFPGYSFDDIFYDLYKTIVEHPEIFGDKDIMIGEFAAKEGDYKALWIQDAFNKIKTKYKKIKAFYWFNVDKEYNWKVDSSQASLEAFQGAMKDPYFLSHQQLADGGSIAQNQSLELKQTCSIPVKIHIPAISAMRVAISRVEIATNSWSSAEEMDFGTLEFDRTYRIFRAGVYFVVDIGILSNQAQWKVSFSATPVTNGIDTLDDNINVVFVSVEDGVEKQLLKTSYRAANGLEFSSQTVNKNWLRIYYGFASGWDDAPEVSPIGLDKSPGDYAGTVTITFVVP